MSIVCGVDFSEHSLSALNAAAELAARMQMPLHVVHAVQLRSERMGNESEAEVVAWATRRLGYEADRLRAIHTSIEVHCAVGAPDEVVVELGVRCAARLIVVAALGHRHPGTWQLGSHAERLAQVSTIPVLVVRASAPFEAWVNKVRPLRVLVGVDSSLSADAALHFVHDLTKFGPCDITAVHLYWPPRQFQRLGLSGARNLLDPDPEVTKALEREIAARLAREIAGSPAQIRVEPHLGRLGDRIAAIAAEQRADLIVVGSHLRDPMDRVLHGSVSRSVLHCARVSVACVPGLAPTLTANLSELRSVLVSTDFSPTGNAAIPLAYAAVASGGTVHLVHVVESAARHVTDQRDIFASDADRTGAAGHADALAQLAALIPKQAARRAIVSQPHILESNDVPTAIYQAAERLDVTALCLGTHGRTGLSKMLLGSVAQSVLSQSRRPILLARLPVE